MSKLVLLALMRIFIQLKISKVLQIYRRSHLGPLESLHLIRINNVKNRNIPINIPILLIVPSLLQNIIGEKTTCELQTNAQMSLSASELSFVERLR